MTAQNRPLSPHLQVYKPQLTSVLSVFHRATGIVLAIGTLLLVYWVVSAAAGPEAFETAQDWIGSPLGYLALFGWSVALYYHLLNGIRHLFWDAGYGFELSQVYRSGWAVLAGTATLTALSWVIGLFVVL